MIFHLLSVLLWEFPPLYFLLFCYYVLLTPPRNANNGVKKNNVDANAVISTAAKLAPLEIPMIPGSASGFFNIA